MYISLIVRLGHVVLVVREEVPPVLFRVLHDKVIQAYWAESLNFWRISIALKHTLVKTVLNIFRLTKW